MKSGIKKIFTKKLLIACLILLATESFAQDLWTGVQQVVSVQVMNHGGFMVNLENEISTVCSPEGTSSILIYPHQNGVTVSGAKSLLSTALIAFSSGNRVNILYSNDTGYCWGKYLLISK
jgi:hypothetical protein